MTDIQSFRVILIKIADTHFSYNSKYNGRTSHTKREQFNGQLAWVGTFNNYRKDKNSIYLEQLIIHREKAKELWEDFNQIQTQIEDEKRILDQSEAYRAEFEELYLIILMIKRILLNSGRTTVVSSSRRLICDYLTISLFL